MVAQRDRVYELIVGNYKTGEGIRITEAQITFDISKVADQKKTKGNSAAIEIYNLSREQAALLEQEYVSCTFSAGYAAQGPRIIVTGNVVECGTTKNGPDRITQIRMGEGYTALNHQFLKQFVSPGKTVASILDEIIKQMPDVARGSITGTNLNNPVVHGWRLTGTPREALKKVCDAYKLEYNVSGGVVNVSDVNGLTTKDTGAAPVISPTTGLVDEPFFVSEDGRKAPKDKRRRKGVQFTALLNTECIPGKIIKLADTTINGFFRVNAVRFNGSYRENPWYMECVCSEIEAEELK